MKFSQILLNSMKSRNKIPVKIQLAHQNAKLKCSKISAFQNNEIEMQQK